MSDISVSAALDFSQRNMGNITSQFLEILGLRDSAQSYSKRFITVRQL